MMKDTFNNFHHGAFAHQDKRPFVFAAMSKKTFCYRIIVTEFILSNKYTPLNSFMMFGYSLFKKEDILTANSNLLNISDALWMFGPVSDGALAEIIMAKEKGIPIKYFAVGSDSNIYEIPEEEVEYEDDLEKYVSTQ